MSHQLAKIRCADGTIYFAEYNGTSDVIIPQLYATQGALYDGWRSGEWRKCTNPSHVHEAAEYAETYADGSHGPIKVCRVCMCITDSSAFDDRWDDHDPKTVIEWANGLPNWWGAGDSL